MAMPELSPRSREVFFEVYEALPRQGPGSLACTGRAFALCRDLPPAPAVLDLGCGGGAQTLHLASLTKGTIAALDRHAPLIGRLTQKVVELGLSHRIRPVVGDMSQPSFPPGSFDLIWSEGALHNIGLGNALRLWRPQLAPRGYLAFTEAVWRQPDPPEEPRAFWDREYPALTDVPANLAMVARAGYDVAGHFTLPAEAWWNDFYTPMEARVRLLRLKYADDREAAVTLDSIEREMDLYRHHSAFYGYEFFVLRRTD